MGDLNIKSTNEQFSCSSLDNKQKHQLFIKGTYTCSADGSQLLTGAKAGIAIGCVFALAVILVGVWWIWRRKRSSVARKVYADSETSESVQGARDEMAAELGNTGLKEIEGQAISRRVEISSSEIKEMESPVSPLEVEGTKVISELSAGHSVAELDGHRKS